MRWMIEELFPKGGFEKIRNDVIRLHTEGKSVDDIVMYIIEKYYVLGGIDDKANIRKHVNNILANKPVVDVYTGKTYNLDNKMDSILKLSTQPNNNEKNQYTITLNDRQELYDREFNELMQIPKEQLVCMLIGLRPI